MYSDQNTALIDVIGVRAAASVCVRMVDLAHIYILTLNAVHNKLATPQCNCKAAKSAGTTNASYLSSSLSVL
jgi:hypothetical protein